MKTRPIKFYLSLSILLFLIGGVYYVMELSGFKQIFLFNLGGDSLISFSEENYFLSKRDLNLIFLDNSFIFKSLEESERILFSTFIFFIVSSSYLKHLYFFLKVCMFFHIFFTLYSVLFDYFRDHMSLTFFFSSAYFFIISFFIL